MTAPPPLFDPLLPTALWWYGWPLVVTAMTVAHLRRRPAAAPGGAHPRPGASYVVGAVIALIGAWIWIGWDGRHVVSSDAITSTRWAHDSVWIYLCSDTGMPLLLSNAVRTLTGLDQDLAGTRWMNFAAWLLLTGALARIATSLTGAPAALLLTGMAVLGPVERRAYDARPTVLAIALAACAWLAVSDAVRQRRPALAAGLLGLAALDNPLQVAWAPLLALDAEEPETRDALWRASFGLAIATAPAAFRALHSAQGGHSGPLDMFGVWPYVAPLVVLGLAHRAALVAAVAFALVFPAIPGTRALVTFLPFVAVRGGAAATTRLGAVAGTCLVLVLSLQPTRASLIDLPHDIHHEADAWTAAHRELLSKSTPDTRPFVVPPACLVEILVAGGALAVSDARLGGPDADGWPLPRDEAALAGCGVPIDGTRRVAVCATSVEEALARVPAACGACAADGPPGQLVYLACTGAP